MLEMYYLTQENIEKLNPKMDLEEVETIEEIKETTEETEVSEEIEETEVETEIALIEKYSVDFHKISDNVVELVGNFPIQTDGFVLSRENMNDDWDYSGFTTIYREIDGGCQFSNDGSIYIEPIPYEPTLEEVKESKISELSDTCNFLIVNGVDMLIDDNLEHFSYNENDQVNIKEIFDLAVQTNVPMYYHADGESCKMYTVEQIVNLYATATTNKMHHTTYFNQLKRYVNDLGEVEDVQAVTYGQELFGDYLDTYNNSMYQAQLVLEALLIKRNELL